jgi:hypothetical protein
MPGTAMPFVKPQWLDSNGDPMAGYQLFTYEAGTTTKLATYSDADLTSANSNPIVLDSAGRASVFLQAASYKFVMAPPNDSDPPVAAVWTVDEVDSLAGFGVNVDIPFTAGENVSFGEVCYMAQGVGVTTAGRWYRADADDGSASVYAPVLGFPTANVVAGATGTMRISGRVQNLGGLSTGNRYYVSTAAGTLTTTRLANMRIVGHADSATTLILTPASLQWRSLTIVIGTVGGAAITSGVKHYLWLPFPFLITGWTLLAEQAGSIVIDIWSDTYTNFPPTVADTIAPTPKPTLAAVQKNQDLVTAFATPLVPRDNVLAFKVDSAATIAYAVLTLEGLVV